MTRSKMIMGLLSAAVLSACATAPEPIPEPVAVVEPEPVRTCVSVSDLRQIIVPDVTKKVIAITEIENPPYEPIQRREEQTRIVTPGYTYYVDETGAHVTEFCEGPQ